ncbi:glycoside hydrolase family 36 protein [Promethearchaeum syntrophicum]|uniref:Glycoside hydrolase family 36 protein n=1 Tax=Promethearchaeum syntrophicum TaxID=2594042 RepID=A0A5B9DCL4_9ARCH|nr:glycoside hydrolase family 36 protein [Candidatus Prometheoarchaeum syntrophicum]QEE16503.1 Melibiase [Candidatus Prometheoarchaeum syntrophicum]
MNTQDKNGIKTKINEDTNNITFKRNSQMFELKNTNDFLTFSLFDNGISLKDGTSALLIREGKKISPWFPFLMKNEKFIPKKTKFSDSIGSGFQIDIKCNFSQNSEEPSKILCLWQFKFYENIQQPKFVHSQVPFVSIQIKIVSVPPNHNSLPLFGFAPLYMKDRGKLLLSSEDSIQNPRNITFYSNGWQSWSMNYLLGYSDKYPSSFVKLGRKVLENQDKTLKGRFQSEFHTVISDNVSHSSLILGFITLKDQFSRILMDRLDSMGKIKWLCAYSQTDSIKLCDLNKDLMSSEVLMISLAKSPEPYEVLYEICNFGGILAEVKNLQKDVSSGWCSWYYYYTKVTEQDVLSNLEYFKQHKDLDISLIQLDDGYQTGIAEWGIYNEKFNSKFPHGLKWLAEQIHNSGFKAGLWVAPFFITKKSNLFQNHPDWLLRTENNRKIIANNNWGFFQYGLDLSIDEAVEYIEDIGKTVSEKWKFDFLKIDFIFASELIEARYKNPIYSRAQILRRGVEAIRKGLGDKCTLLGCGAPLGPCVGLVDVMRVGPDTAAEWTHLEPIMEKFATVVSCNLKAALRSTIQRSYLHQTWWINDPDCVVVRENKSKLTYDEIILQITVFGLSGGQFLISDDEKLVHPHRIELLKRLSPPFSRNYCENEQMKYNVSSQISYAVPLDIFFENLPTLYTRTIFTPFGQRHLTSIINWSNKNQIRSFKLSQLITYKDLQNYKHNQKFIIFNYWKEIIEGIYDLEDEIELEISPHGCEYIAIVPYILHEPRVPIFLSSTLHILQGGQEIKQVDNNHKKIRITLELPGSRTGALFFFSPDVKKYACSTNNLSEITYKTGLVLKIPLQLKEKQAISLDWDE